MKPTELFINLLHAWHADSASDAVDIIAAELAARLGAAGHPVCLALVQTTALPRVYGVAVFLGGYGVILSQKHRGKRDGCYVFAEVVLSGKGEFDGAVVREAKRERALRDEEAA